MENPSPSFKNYQNEFHKATISQFNHSCHVNAALGSSASRK